MYCPKCSAALEEDPRGWLRCSSGQLEFSIDLSQKLAKPTELPYLLPQRSRTSRG